MYNSDRDAETSVNIQFEGNEELKPSVTDIIVKAAVKEELDEMNVSSDFYDARDEEVSELLDSLLINPDALDNALRRSS